MSRNDREKRSGGGDERVTESRLRELAGRVLEARRRKDGRGAGDRAPPPLTRRTGGGPVPLSPAQERLWFLRRLHGGRLHNVTRALRLTGDVDPAALHRALAAVIQRHEALRSAVLETGDGAVVQRVERRVSLPLPTVDLSALGPAERDGEERRMRCRAARRSVDVTRAPPLSCWRLHLGPDEQLLILTVHHLFFDGRSLQVVVEDLETAYGNAVAGRRPSLPPAPLGFADFAAWRRRCLEEGHLESELDWWQGWIGSPPDPVDVSPDAPRPAHSDLRSGEVGVTLPGSLERALSALAAERGLGPFALLLTAWAVLLGRWSGRRRVLVGSPVEQRREAGLDDVVGFFVNTLPAVVDLDGDPTVEELLRRGREAVLALLEHSRAPLTDLLRRVAPRRADNGVPLFQSILALHDGAAPRSLAGGVTLEVEDVDPGVSEMDLMLLVERRGEAGGSAGFSARLVYRAALFHRTTVERLAGGWLRLLSALAEAAVETPQRRLSGLPVLSAAQRHALRHEWSRGPAGGHRDATVPRLFAEVAAAGPERVAVEEGERSLTYRQLAARSRTLARHLRRVGVGPETRVGVAIERSLDAVVAFLGVLEAGATFVPLDPAYPAERLALMVRDAAAPVVITRGGLPHPPVAADAAILDLAELNLAAAAPPPPEELPDDAGLAVSPSPPLPPDALAYVMYTSGSTGRPKGVAVPHRGIVRLVGGGGFADLGPEQTFLGFAPLSFDASTLEIWGTLLHGGRLVVAPAGPTDLAALGELIAERGVTSLWLTAGLFHQMVDENLDGLRGVGQLLTGGDVLSPHHVRRVLEELPEVRLINGYGPTENTTFTTCHTARGPEVGSSVPIGRPLADTTVHVLGPRLDSVPMGAVGELCTGGDGLARGYLGDPARTAAAFVPDPFADRPGGRLYRTGDLVRWRPDGSLDFLGRADRQVKLRGFRIEVGEVEAALAARPAVRAAVVVPRGEGERRRLVAYVVLDDAPSGAPDGDELLAAVATILPAYMLPSALVVLDTLPLNPNGKVDRDRLPEPESGATATERVAPRDDTEALLVDLYRRVLDVGEVGVHDDFFALGGHSLLVTRLMARLRTATGVELPMADLFEASTPASLAARLQAVRGDGGGERPAAEPAPRREAFTAPVSAGQRRLWFLARVDGEGGAGAYVIPLAVELCGALEAGALGAALRAVVRRHEVLRTRFAEEGGEPVQVVEPEVLLGDAGDRLPAVDLSALPAPATEAARLARRMARRPFDLARRPLMRTALLRLALRRHRLVLVVHHAVFDAGSLDVLLAELARFYAAARAGRAVAIAAGDPLPPLPAQYRHHAERQRRREESGELAAHLNFWRRRLADLPTLDLPTDRPRPPVQRLRGAQHRFTLPAAAVAAVEEAARELGSTPFHLYLAVLQALLGRWSHQRDFAVGTPVAQRETEEEEGLVGFFANTLVLRTDLAGDPEVGELVRRVRGEVLEAHAHRAVPFERVVGELSPQRGLDHAPLFQVMLAFHHAAPPRRWPGLEVSVRGVEAGATAFDLTLGLRRGEAGLDAYLEYDRDLFDAVTVQRLSAAFRRLLRGAVETPRRRLSELPLLGDAERHQLLAEWSGRVRAAPDGAALPADLLAAAAAERPGAVALVCGDEEWTWDRLARRAAALRAELTAAGVGPEARVAVLLPRGGDLVAALWAVLAAGGGFLVLEPGTPRRRVAGLLDDAGVHRVVTDRALADRLPADRKPLFADEVGSGDGLQPPSPRPVPPTALAYLIYTSGSTGRPKGVAVSHGAFAAHAGAVRERFALTPDDVVLAFASLSFDVALEQLLAPLCAGARVVLRGEESWGLDELGAALAEHRVTVADLPAALWRQWTEGLGRGAAEWPSLRLVSCGGEAMPPAAAAGWGAGPLQRVRLVNAYGPTETVVTATCWSVPPRFDPAAGHGVALGSPLAGRTAYVLDAAGRPVPTGVHGELAVGGPILARGYAGRPAQTAERFRPDPFAGVRGARLYLTGDRVRFRNDGLLEFHGRLDDQLKVRGFRVEPGEVEAVLEALPAVRAAAVGARGEAAGRRLVAWVALEAGTGPVAVRRELSRRLPAHLVPDAWVWLEELPRGASGKVDRDALPEPEVETGDAAATPPRSALERTVARVWCRVLERDRVGVRDNFFDVGGHSLLLVQVQQQLEEELGRELRLMDLFRHTTVAALAAHLADDGSEADVEEAAESEPVRAAAPAVRPDGDEGAVAVVGMACRFPDADTPEAFWRNLCDGVESIRPFDRDELLAAGVDETLLDDPAYVAAGTHLPGVGLFDAPFFDLAPREAAMMDPQQRVFLEVCWQALERAGHDPRGAGKVGVFAGVGANWYLLHNLMRRPDLVRSFGYFGLLNGNDKDSLATQVAYKLDLSGPALVVQTACSTSLVATHLARRSLLQGECGMALAGGVSISVPNPAGYRYQEGNILSTDGHCRPFDAGASGTVPGSGAAVVVLKRLADARADGNPIHAVIRGSAMNNDGHHKVGYTAPSIDGQAEVVAAALADAGVEPASIGYVEAHGTGTRLGDPIEVAALARVFDGDHPGCGLGSVKSNLGHLDTAAGVAGLMKAALALEHRRLPPSLHFERPNPELELEATPFRVVDRLQPWEGAGPRRAGVSSFGIGGTNVHVVLEEAPPAPAAAADDAVRPQQLLPLAARNPAALSAAAERLADHLESEAESADPGAALADVAWTLQVGRTGFGHRAAVVAADRRRAVAALRSGPAVTTAAGSPRPVVFLFPGQGAQRAGMGADLYATEPVYRRHLDAGLELLRPLLDADPAALLHPAEGERRRADDALADTALTQPLLFLHEYALAELWRSWGVEPAAMLGHSLGEYVGACLAGVFSFADALRLVAARGRLMGELPGGAMLAVARPSDEVAPRLPEELTVAAVNAPDSTVVSGPSPALESLARQLADDGVKSRRLIVSHAFHSPMMDACLDAYREAVGGMERRPPERTVISNLTGEPLSAAQATDADYWAAQLRRTVRFSAGARRLLEDGDAVFLEVGPGRTLTSLLRRHPAARGRLALTSSARPGEADRPVALESLGRLWAEAGVAPRWAGLHEDGDGRHARRRVVLPTYPFQRQRYWVDPVAGDISPAAETAEGEAAPPPGAALGDHERPPGLSTAYRRPADGDETRIAAVWEEVLGVRGVGAADDFLELGGDSLLAVQLLARVKEETGVEVPVSRFFDAPTVAALAELCDELRQSGDDGGDDLAEALAAVGSLSDEEVEALLAAEDRDDGKVAP